MTRRSGLYTDRKEAVPRAQQGQKAGSNVSFRLRNVQEDVHDVLRTLQNGTNDEGLGQRAMSWAAASVCLHQFLIGSTLGQAPPHLRTFLHKFPWQLAE